MPLCKCGKSATYDVPSNLCDNCWFDWWTENYLKDGLCTPEELEEMRREHLEQCRTLDRKENDGTSDD
jgi:hypothetical protein